MGTRTPVPAAPSSKKASKDAVDALEQSIPVAITEIPLDLIEPHPDNPRKSLGDLTELTASIMARGVLQNCVLAPHPTKKSRYVTVIGHRRVAGARKAGLTTVPARIDDSMDHRAQIGRMLEENLQRNDLTVIEEANAYQGLLDLGATVDEIAAQTGRAVKTVEQRLRVAKMEPATQKAITEHVVTLEQALMLDDLQALSQSAYKTLMDNSSYRRITTNDLEMALKKARKKADHAACKAEFKAAGFKPINNMYGGVPDGNAALEDLKLTAAEHEACPGRGVVADFGEYGDPRNKHTLVCTNPEKYHPGVYKAPKKQPSQDNWQVQQEQQHQLNKLLATAAEARAEWVSGQMYDASPEAKPRQDALLKFTETAMPHISGTSNSLFHHVDGDEDKGRVLLPTAYATFGLFAMGFVDGAVPKSVYGFNNHEQRKLRLAKGYLGLLTELGCELAPADRVVLTVLEEHFEAIDGADSDEARAKITFPKVVDVLKRIEALTPTSDDTANVDASEA